MKDIKLVWEKWENVYEEEAEELEEDYYDEEMAEEDAEFQKQILIFSQPEYETQNVDISKLFKFWVCHCNFNVDQDCVSIIENCEGVETLEIITRYRFRISVGKVFQDREVMSKITEKVTEYINEKNSE